MSEIKNKKSLENDITIEVRYDSTQIRNISNQIIERFERKSTVVNKHDLLITPSERST